MVGCLGMVACLGISLLSEFFRIAADLAGANVAGRWLVGGVTQRSDLDALQLLGRQPS